MATTMAEKGFMMKSQMSHQVPAFGYWDHCDDIPITQYFESAMQAELIHGHYFAEDAGDLFHASAIGRPPAYLQSHRKAKKKDCGAAAAGEKQQHSSEELQRKQARAITPKAVDEDLYKVPPEFFYQKPKRKKRLLKNLWSGCMRVSI